MSPYRSMPEAAMAALDEIVHEAQRRRLKALSGRITPTTVSVSPLEIVSEFCRRIAPNVTACQIDRDMATRGSVIGVRMRDGRMLSRQIPDASLEDAADLVRVLVHAAYDLACQAEGRTL